jgi:hypothetical protein
LAQAHKILVNALALACQICPQARDRAQHGMSVHGLGPCKLEVVLSIEVGQEHSAEATAEALERSVAVRSAVRRDGTVKRIPVEDVLPAMSASLPRAISCQPTASCWRVGRRRIPTSRSSPASLTQSRNEPAIVWLKTRLKPSMRCSVALPCERGGDDARRRNRITHAFGGIAATLQSDRPPTLFERGRPARHRSTLSECLEDHYHLLTFIRGSPVYLRDSHDPQRCP